MATPSGGRRQPRTIAELASLGELQGFEAGLPIKAWVKSAEQLYKECVDPSSKEGGGVC